MSVLKYCVRCGGLKPQRHRHKVDRTVAQRRARYDAKWEKVSKQFRQHFPICQWKDGCINRAAHVHHIDGDPEGEHRYDWGNLQSLCASHHAQITARERPSGWNAPGYVRQYDET